LLSDMPRLHRSFYDDDIPVPDGWSSGPCAYLQLSPAYHDEFRRAKELGWPTAILDGTHLSIVTDPEVVLAAVHDLAEQLDVPKFADPA